MVERPSTSREEVGVVEVQLELMPKYGSGHRGVQGNIKGTIGAGHLRDCERIFWDFH